MPGGVHADDDVGGGNITVQPRLRGHHARQEAAVLIGRRKALATVVLKDRTVQRRSWLLARSLVPG
jgi:hypothetical protein